MKPTLADTRKAADGRAIASSARSEAELELAHPTLVGKSDLTPRTPRPRADVRALLFGGLVALTIGLVRQDPTPSASPPTLRSPIASHA